MTAATFAEAGEPELARELLGKDSCQGSVLYVLQDEEPPSAAARYAASLSSRLGCGLAVLQVRSGQDSQPPATAPAAAPENGCRPAAVYQASGELKAAVRRFLAEHRRIVSVVLTARAAGEAAAGRESKRRPWWQDLGCPVVIVPAADG
ncbi:MAG: hypothetical protein AB1634_18785 [Thermodesulfobacteriota bacterium]